MKQKKIQIKSIAQHTISQDDVGLRLGTRTQVYEVLFFAKEVLTVPNLRCSYNA